MGSGHHHLHAPQHHHHPDGEWGDGQGSDAQGAESPLGPSAEASVVLDIGPHAGALVLYTSEGLAGAEIEIRPGAEPWLGAHTAVRPRHVGDGVVFAGVFGSLAPGLYDLRLKGGGPGSFELTVDVAAGAVTEARVPTSVPRPISAPLSGASLG